MRQLLSGLEQQSVRAAEDSKAQQEGRGLSMNGTGQEKVYGLESRCRLSALALAIFSSKEALDRVSTDADSCKHVIYNLTNKDM